MRNKFLPVLALAIFTLTSCADQGVGIHKSDAAPPGSPATTTVQGVPAPPAVRTLFLRNCAHCHGTDARGDDGPDLHDLDLSADGIANRIRHGKAGQMTAFGGKLSEDQIIALAGYVKSLGK